MEAVQKNRQEEILTRMMLGEKLDVVFTMGRTALHCAAANSKVDAARSSEDGWIIVRMKRIIWAYMMMLIVAVWSRLSLRVRVGSSKERSK